MTTAINPRILDPISMPLQGHALIEASAGTGKTYTLAALYLRLLLGIGRDSSLEVAQILVVTFTQAATQELRERIRSRIQDARMAFSVGVSDDPFISQLLALHSDHAQGALDLEFAASEMDQAAIFTIHGFCQRMLEQHAFESGASFSAKLMSDDSGIVRQALLDYWRNTLYCAPVSLAQEILSLYPTPQKLYSQIRGYLGLSNLLLQPDYSGVELVPRWDEFLRAQQILRESLLKVISSEDPSDDLQALIQNSSVDKRSYSKRNLPNWYAKLEQFAAGDKAPFKELLKFSQQQLIDKCKDDKVPRHPIFEQLEAFCQNQLDIKSIIFCQGLIAVRENMQREKEKLQLLSFDDLLEKLATALVGNSAKELANAIAKQYPFALIDEFQDTDEQQYQIFSSIYSAEQQGAQELGLLMIGDPKQSIYAFRGADIFTYMQARRQLENHYTLATNWRSSSAMVSATNHLFMRSPAPFVYNDDIPFVSVEAANKEESALQLNGLDVPAMTFLFTEQAFNSDQYLHEYATLCASKIEQMLAGGTIKGRQVCPIDVAVLVRDRKEAALVQQALAQLKIDSVFMSNRENIYQVNLARELEYILKAVQEPSNERYMRTAIATEIFQLTANELYQLNEDELAWEALVEECVGYREIWWRSGVLAMLQALLQQRNLAKRWLAQTDGERRLTDYLHLAELLQQASVEFNSHEALIRFLQDKRAAQAEQSQEQQLRLDSDRDRVSVITIHKSKGLEYNLVYLPFISRYRSTTNKLYHDDSGQAVLDTAGGEDKSRIDKEQLAEDLRLLYVAITRAVYGCFMGVANVTLRNKSVWQKTAVGYLLTLIQNGEESLLLDDASLGQALAMLKEENSAISIIDIQNIALSQGDLFGAVIDSPPVAKEFSVRPFSRQIRRQWRLTSYSALVRDAQHAPALENSKLDLEAAADSEESSEEASELMPYSSIFSFAKGAVAGTFLHSIYEEIDFTAKNSDEIEQVLTERLPLSGYDLQWLPCLTDFVFNSLDVLLEPDDTRHSFKLKQISCADRLVEMEFVMPFKSIQSQTINQLLQRYDRLAKLAGDLSFSAVEGMLKGFIDLTLRVNGRYYVVDYKSNFLGEEPLDYSLQAMEQSMIEHRYDFQYVLYTLALHRLLRSRLADYDYDTHIGGVFYLFLRGMQTGRQSGVYFCKPERSLIAALDLLFEEGE